MTKNNHHLEHLLTDETLHELINQPETSSLLLRVHGFGGHRRHWCEKQALTLKNKGLPVIDVDYNTAHSILENGKILYMYDKTKCRSNIYSLGKQTYYKPYLLKLD